MVGKDGTIKFDYDAVQQAYGSIRKIREEAEKLLETLEGDSNTAEGNMKGHYREAYVEKSEASLKNFKKSIENIDTLSEKMESTAKDFLNMDMILADSYGKS